MITIMVQVLLKRLAMPKKIKIQRTDAQKTMFRDSRIHLLQQTSKTVKI